MTAWRETSQYLILAALLLGCEREPPTPVDVQSTAATEQKTPWQARLDDSEARCALAAPDGFKKGRWEGIWCAFGSLGDKPFRAIQQFPSFSMSGDTELCTEGVDLNGEWVERTWYQKSASICDPKNATPYPWVYEDRPWEVVQEEDASNALKGAQQ